MASDQRKYSRAVPEHLRPSEPSCDNVVTTTLSGSSLRANVSAICWLAFAISGRLSPDSSQAPARSPEPAISGRMRTADLLDANETTWAFVAVERVGRVRTALVRGLAALAAKDRYRNYCGRSTSIPSQRKRRRWPIKAQVQHGRGAPTIPLPNTCRSSAVPALVCRVACALMTTADPGKFGQYTSDPRCGVLRARWQRLAGRR